MILTFQTTSDVISIIDFQLLNCNTSCYKNLWFWFQLKRAKRRFCSTFSTQSCRTHRPTSNGSCGKPFWAQTETQKRSSTTLDPLNWPTKSSGSSGSWKAKMSTLNFRPFLRRCSSAKKRLSVDRFWSTPCRTALLRRKWSQVYLRWHKFKLHRHIII